MDITFFGRDFLTNKNKQIMQTFLLIRADYDYYYNDAVVAVSDEESTILDAIQYYKQNYDMLCGLYKDCADKAREKFKQNDRYDFEVDYNVFLKQYLLSSSVVIENQIIRDMFCEDLLPDKLSCKKIKKY